LQLSLNEAPVLTHGGQVHIGLVHAGAGIVWRHPPVVALGIPLFAAGEVIIVGGLQAGVLPGTAGSWKKYIKHIICKYPYYILMDIISFK